MRMETWLFEAAIPLMKESEFALAEAIADEAMAHGDVENWGELNWRFHEALYTPSEKKIAMRLPRTLHDNANR